MMYVCMYVCIYIYIYRIYLFMYFLFVYVSISLFIYLHYMICIQCCKSSLFWPPKSSTSRVMTPGARPGWSEGWKTGLWEGRPRKVPWQQHDFGRVDPKSWTFWWELLGITAACLKMLSTMVFHVWHMVPKVRKSWDTETQIQWLFFIGFWMFLIIFPMKSAILMMAC